MADHIKSPKKSNTVKSKIKAFNSKQKKKKSNKNKKKSHNKSRSSTTSPKKTKKKKSKKKRNKTKHETHDIPKPPIISLDYTDENVNSNVNTPRTPTQLLKTNTSPLQASSLMAQASIETNDLEPDTPTNLSTSPRPLSPFQQIQEHKTNSNSNSNSNSINRHKSSSSYFQNYFDRSHIKPEEMIYLLDRIENDIQFMFSDSFLSNSIRTKKIYAMSVSLHSAFMQYKLSFLFPLCRLSLIELDSMFCAIIKWFNRLKRYYRSPSMSKYKQQITKLKNDVDRCINNIESHCSIVLYALIRCKELYFEFHKNSKLLIFWISLFPENELEFIELSWINFVHHIVDHKSFKKFKKFNKRDMIRVLTQNYEVLTVSEFIIYVAEYESVEGWMNDMYKYIGEEIAHPHKKHVHVHRNRNRREHNDNDIETEEKEKLSEWIQTSEESIKNMIQTEITPKINDLVTRFDHIEQSLAMMRSQNEQQQLYTRTNSMIIHDSDANSLDSDDDEKLKDTTTKDMMNIQIDGLVSLSLQTAESDGTVVIHQTPNSVQVTPIVNDINQFPNLQKRMQTSPSYSSVSASASTLVIEKERESWNKTVKALEAEISALKSGNYEQKETIRDYELRLEGVALKSKQVFTLQSKLDYHERLSVVIKKRCFALHQQLSRDLMHFIECDTNKDTYDMNDGNNIGDSVQNAITEIFSIHQQLKDLCVQDVKPDGIIRKVTDSPETPQPAHLSFMNINKMNQEIAPIPAASATAVTSINITDIEIPRSRTRSRTSYGRQGPQSQSASATPYNDDKKRTVWRQRSHNPIRRRSKMRPRPQSSRQHLRQQTYSIMAPALKQINDESALSYSDYDEDTDANPPSRLHLRGQSVSSNHLRIVDSHRRKRSKMTKHSRFKTAAVNFNFAFLSPTVAFDGADDGVSDVISTLSNTDYTYLLDEYSDYEEYDDNPPQYVNIFNNEEHIPLHMRSQSYRFPGHNTRYSVVDPLTILDEKILSQLNEKQDFTQSEMVMKEALLAMLREMDLMGEGRLDIADFTSGIMNAVNDYDDIMDDAELMFETMQNLQDDMGAIKIEDLVNAIILNHDDGAAKNIKQEIMCGLQLDANDDGNDANIQEDIYDIEEIMPALNVEPIYNDPNQEPFKPIYQISNGIQKINAND